MRSTCSVCLLLLSSFVLVGCTTEERSALPTTSMKAEPTSTTEAKVEVLAQERLKDLLAKLFSEAKVNAETDCPAEVATGAMSKGGLVSISEMADLDLSELGESDQATIIESIDNCLGQSAVDDFRQQIGSQQLPPTDMSKVWFTDDDIRCASLAQFDSYQSLAKWIIAKSDAGTAAREILEFLDGCATVDSVSRLFDILGIDKLRDSGAAPEEFKKCTLERVLKDHTPAEIVASSSDSVPWFAFAALLCI